MNTANNKNVNKKHERWKSECTTYTPNEHPSQVFSVVILHNKINALTSRFYVTYFVYHIRPFEIEIERMFNLAKASKHRSSLRIYSHFVVNTRIKWEKKAVLSYEKCHESLFQMYGRDEKWNVDNVKLAYFQSFMHALAHASIFTDTQIQMHAHTYADSIMHHQFYIA